MRTKKSVPAASSVSNKSSHPTAGGKAPRNTTFHQEVVELSNKKKAGQSSAEKLPWTRRDILKVRLSSKLSDEERDALRKTQWKDQSYVLAAEQVEEPEEFAADIRIMRVVNEFSMWLYRQNNGKNKKQWSWRPTAPAPGGGEEWSDFMLRGRVASLNGPGCFLAASGEFFVPWPTLESVPMRLRKGEIEDIALVSDPAFRGGQPALAVYTKEYIYFLLTPDFFFEDQWRSVIHFWEEYMEVKGLYIEDRDPRLPREVWWKGNKSFRAYREWVEADMGSRGEALADVDTSRDGSQPDDLSDDEVGLDEWLKERAEASSSEGTHPKTSEAEEDEDRVEMDVEDQAAQKPKGKARAKPPVEANPRSKPQSNSKTEAKSKPKPKAKSGHKPRGDDAEESEEGWELDSQKEDTTKSERASYTSSSKAVTGTGPPKRLAVTGTSEKSVIAGSKRRAVEDYTVQDSVRPRLAITPAQDVHSKPLPPADDHNAAGGSSNTRLLHPAFSTQSQAAHVEGVSEEFGHLKLGSQQPSLSAESFFPAGDGWSFPQVGGGSFNIPLASCFDVDYDPADASEQSVSQYSAFPSFDFAGINPQSPQAEMEEQHLQQVQVVLQRSDGENTTPFDNHAPHAFHFPAR